MNIFSTDCGHGHFFCRSCDSPYCDNDTMPKVCTTCGACCWLHFPSNGIVVWSPDGTQMGIGGIPVNQQRRLAHIIFRLNAVATRYEERARAALILATAGRTMH